MRAVAISQPGPADVLQVVECPVPAFKAGELLIKVHAAGINRPDVLQRLAIAPPAGASDLPGLEVAGEIVDGDFTGTAFRKGDLVCALVQGGGYAEYCAAPAGQCLPLPKGLTALEGASLPENFFTVWSNVFDRCALADGETLLVQGGTSGIGVTAIQLAAALGHRVFATAGSDEKARACEALGAERGINYRTEDFGAVVKELTNGKGVDVILDMVGGDYLPREIACLADDGRIGLIAVQGGTKAELDMGLAAPPPDGDRFHLRPRSVAFKAAIAQPARDRLAADRGGQDQARDLQTFPLEKANEAHALMEASTHVGKIMLQVA
jgi:NADPH2:quinone reductase